MQAASGGLGGEDSPQSVWGSEPVLACPQGHPPGFGSASGWVGSRMMQTPGQPWGASGKACPTNAFPPGRPPPARSTHTQLLAHLTSFHLRPPLQLLRPWSLPQTFLPISETPHLICPLDLPQSRLGPPLSCSETCSSSPGPGEMPKPPQHPGDSDSPSVNEDDGDHHRWLKALGDGVPAWQWGAWSALHRDRLWTWGKLSASDGQWGAGKS